jgi:hypothetical protein
MLKYPGSRSGMETLLRNAVSEAGEPAVRTALQNGVEFRSSRV